MMKRIAMYSTGKIFADRVTGGTKRFVELYKSLIAKGYQVDLYSTDDSRDIEKYKISNYQLKSGNKSNNVFFPTEFKILFKNFSKLINLKKSNYDAVIVFDVPPAIGLSLFRVKNIKLFLRQDLVGYKEIILKEYSEKRLIISLYIGFLKLCESFSFVSANKIIIQCEYDLNQLIARHRIIKNIIQDKSVIQINNVNPSWIVEKSKDAYTIFPQEERNEENKFVVGFIGNFNDERKGHRIFIEAVKNLLDKGIKIEAYIVGDGPKLSAYKNDFSKYSEIKFTGRLDNPMGVIRKCNLMVVPSLADSCPNTVLEALYNETPVIGACSGGIPEILNSSEALFNTSYLVLQEKIEYYMNDVNLMKLKMTQIERKKQLTFNWGDRIIDIIGD